MTTPPTDTKAVVLRAVDGDPTAVQELLARYRTQLTRMIAVRLNPRLRGRLDPSDIVQEVFLEATRKLASEFEHKRVEFYPWLRGLAWDRLCRLHRHHVSTQKRSVNREEPLGADQFDDESLFELAECIAADGSGPGSHVVREETRRRVREAVTELPATDRQVIALRFLEQLSTQDTAAVMGISLTAAKSRQLRAIARLQALLRSEENENEP